MATALVGLIIIQALIAAGIVGFSLWWYKRSLGQGPPKPGPVVRVMVVIIGVLALVNLVSSDGDLIDALPLMAMWACVAGVAIVAGLLIRHRPDLSRLIIPLASVLAAGIALVGGIIFFGPTLDDIQVEEGPMLPPGRIELPDPGFAVTFPEDWQVREPTADWEEAWGSSSEGWRTLVYGRPPGATGPVFCGLVDASAGRGKLDRSTFLRAWAAAIERSAKDSPEVVDYDGSTISLPVGTVTTSDFTWDDGLQGTFYNYADDTRWVYLDCRSQEPTDDRWLSIAETFEWLPEEE